MNNERSYADLENDLNGCVTGIKEVCVLAWHNLKKIFYGSEPLDHMGVVQNVYPINDGLENLEGQSRSSLLEDLPDRYMNGCYHYIKMVDGSRFQLMFTDTKIEEMQSHISPGKRIKILYRMPNYEVVQIYPVKERRVRTASLKDILDEEELEISRASVKAHYVEGQLIQIEFVPMRPPKVSEITLEEKEL